MGCSGSKPEKDTSANVHSVKKGNEQTRGSGHIMISYNWKHKKLILKIKDILKNKGFPVWIDVENMGPDVDDSMADAVEKSEIVLVCMSKKYKTSKNCKKEAQYANTKGKRIIPLVLEKNYKADGWLGLVTAGQLYYDISSKNNFKENMNTLLKALNEYYPKKETPSETVDEESLGDGNYDEEAWDKEFNDYDDANENHEDDDYLEDTDDVDEEEERSAENVDDDGHCEDTENASNLDDVENTNNLENDDYVEDDQNIEEDGDNIIENTNDNASNEDDENTGDLNDDETTKNNDENTDEERSDVASDNDNQ